MVGEPGVCGHVIMRGPCLWNWGTPRTWGGPDRGGRGRQGPRLGSTPRLKHSNSFPNAPQQIKNINVPRCLGISPSCRLPAGEYSPAQPPWQRSEGGVVAVVMLSSCEAR